MKKLIKQIEWLEEIRSWLKNDPEAVEVIDGLLDEKKEEWEKTKDAMEGRR
ncbi:MAG TPA: hypothetical protein PLD55_04420 [bacterium]|nr:hypothetical protein [bacterium]